MIRSISNLGKASLWGIAGSGLLLGIFMLLSRVQLTGIPAERKFIAMVEPSTLSMAISAVILAVCVSLVRRHRARRVFLDEILMRSLRDFENLSVQQQNEYPELAQIMNSRERAQWKKARVRFDEQRRGKRLTRWSVWKTATFNGFAAIAVCMSMIVLASPFVADSAGSVPFGPSPAQGSGDHCCVGWPMKTKMLTTGSVWRFSDNSASLMWLLPEALSAVIGIVVTGLSAKSQQSKRDREQRLTDYAGRLHTETV